ncbi:MAG: glycerol kinase GlpK [Deltaproteobacteria bacterium]|nr:glycerol kinase GlpK [Deltaproteobacteria bacterium]
MAKFVAAIDQGTTSTRFMIFDHSSRVVGSAQLEHKQVYPKPGWVEHDPMEILRRTHNVIRTALARARIKPDQLAAVGITNQRETTVVWDRTTGRPICNALVWQDTRTSEICRTLARGKSLNQIRSLTGLPIATYFSGPKIKWILDNVRGARAKAKQKKLLFGNMDTWLIWNLTGGTKGGVHVTDVTNASRTMLMNLKTLDWDLELLKAMNIPRSLLPEIKSSSEVYGHGQGTLPGVPIAGDLGDQQAALFGQTCFAPGESKNTYGTGCFLLLNTGTKLVRSRHGLITTVAYQMKKEKPVYALEGSIAITGALVQWLRDNLELVKKSSDVEQLARSVEDNGGIYFVPAFSGLFAPYWRDDARGAILGMSHHTNKGHLARATLEATAFQTREIVDAMEKDVGRDIKTLKVDGGMVVNELLMQFQSDVLGIPTVRPRITETTSLGAAYAAGLATGFWKDMSALRRYWRQEKTWKPRMPKRRRETLYKDWKKAVSRTIHWVESN